MDTAETNWQAQYEFWHKILTEEVERRRFNEGYEPIDITMYFDTQTNQWMGKFRLGTKTFHALAWMSRDKLSKRIQRVQIRAD